MIFRIDDAYMSWDPTGLVIYRRENHNMKLDTFELSFDSLVVH